MNQDSVTKIAAQSVAGGVVGLIFLGVGLCLRGLAALFTVTWESILKTEPEFNED